MYDENSTPVPLSNPEDLRRAVRESNQRLSKMSEEERNALREAALKRIFPNGHWTCKRHAHVRPKIGIGDTCAMCNEKEHLFSRLQRKNWFLRLREFLASEFAKDLLLVVLTLILLTVLVCTVW